MRRRRRGGLFSALLFFFCFFTASAGFGAVLYAMDIDLPGALPAAFGLPGEIVTGAVSGADPGASGEVSSEQFSESRPRPAPVSSILLYGEEWILDKTGEGTAYYRPVAGRETPEVLLGLLAEAGMEPGGDAGANIRRALDAVSAQLEYDYGAAEAGIRVAGNDPWTFWSLCSGKAVCSGYVECFQFLCESAGMECWYATGYLAEPGMDPTFHAWCLVRGQDGLSVWVDPTASDQLGGPKTGTVLWDAYEGKDLCRRYRISGWNEPGRTGFPSGPKSAETESTGVEIDLKS